MINVENLIAVNDKRNGQNRFKVYGTVTVDNPGITPVLREPTRRHRGAWEVLQLELVDDGGITLQVLTEKTVHFEREGASIWGMVEINYPGGTGHIKIVTLD
ncbi:hypothetical protein [Pseudomonas sp. NPDC089401]|uniref:hypothetical protein n=1 Tax=Pseudomonas sp. NPDC089401 TaxID=3364462 RepID=UPI00381B017C